MISLLAEEEEESNFCLVAVGEAIMSTYSPGGGVFRVIPPEGGVVGGQLRGWCCWRPIQGAVLSAANQGVPETGSR